jgi:hypothetical protein
MCFFIEAKFHYHGTGAVGHHFGFWVGVGSFMGFSAKAMLGIGNRRFSLMCVGLALVDMWYEMGRFHAWQPWWTEFQRENGNVYLPKSSAFTEYVPTDLPVELLPFRALHSVDDDPQ